MRKFFTVALFVIMLISIGTVCASAEERSDKILEDFESIIPNESRVGVEDGEMSYIGIDSLANAIFNSIDGKSGAYARFFLVCFGFAVIFSVCEGCGIFDNGYGTASMASAALSSLLCWSLFSSLGGALIEVREGLSGSVSFFTDLLPILSSINLAGGAVESAAVQGVGIGITLSILSKISVEVLLPMAFLLFITTFTSSVTDSGDLRASGGIKSLFTWGMGVVCTVLAGSLAIQSLIATAKDSASIRAARYVASGMIPIVGTSISSALSTLGGGLAFIKSVVGAGSIGVILSVSLAPLVSLLIYRIAISFCIFFLESSGCRGGVRSFSAFKSSLDGVIAVYSMSILVCIIELVVFIRGGNGML